ncbi:MAG: 50S ribosomal protein L4 [Lentimicrobiaceae bacterium]|nr:50S ribosomal protein L4 [Lentimicrobiaceae bacterium]
MELEVYKINGEKANRTVIVSDDIFNITPNDHAIYLDTKQYLANQRQGTHATKEKSTVSGSTKKLKRQKGTGGARAGSIKSPVFVGGARAFGPQPRDYRFKLNKKLKQLARKSALAYKAKENSIVILEDFTFEQPKTKNFLNLLKSFDLNDKKTLFVFNQTDKNIYLSTRNLTKVKSVNALGLNTYDILNANSLIVSESSIGQIEEMFS